MPTHLLPQQWSLLLRGRSAQGEPHTSRGVHHASVSQTYLMRRSLPQSRPSSLTADAKSQSSGDEASKDTGWPHSSDLSGEGQVGTAEGKTAGPSPRREVRRSWPAPRPGTPPRRQRRYSGCHWQACGPRTHLQIISPNQDGPKLLMTQEKLAMSLACKW